MKLQWQSQEWGAPWTHKGSWRFVFLLMTALLGGLCTVASMAQSRVALGDFARVVPGARNTAEERATASETGLLSIPSMGFTLSAEGAVFDMVGIPGSARLVPLTVEFPRGSETRAIAAAGNTVVFAERHRALLRFYRRMRNGEGVHSQIEVSGPISATALSPDGNVFALAVTSDDVIRLLTLSDGPAREAAAVPRIDGGTDVAFLQVANDASRLAVGHARGGHLEIYEVPEAATPRFLGVFEREAQVVMPGSGAWLAIYEPGARMLSRYAMGTLVGRGLVAGEPAKAADTAKLVDIGGSPILLDVVDDRLVACGADGPCLSLPAAVGRVAHAGALPQNGLTSVLSADSQRPIYVLERDRHGNLAVHFVAR